MVDLQRGDCVWLSDHAVARGREQQGARYAVVVQADVFQALSTVVVAPTSTRARPATFRPEVVIAGETTRVLVEHVRAVDPSRLGPLVDRLDGSELAAVDEALRLVLDL